MPLLNWSPQSRIPGAHTTGLPQLAAFQNKVYGCWPGINDSNGYYSVFDGKNWTPNQTQIPGAVAEALTVTAFNNLLYFFWTVKIDPGTRGLHRAVICYRTFDGTHWGSVSQVPNLQTGDFVSAAVFQDALYIAFRGVAELGDDSIHWMKMINSAWSAPKDLAGGASTLGPALAVFQNRLFAIWQGVPGDDGIYWSTCSDGANWTSQHNIPNVGTTGIPGLAALPDRLCAAWKGIDGDDGIYCSYLQGNGPWAQPQQKVAGSGSAVGPGLVGFNNQVIAAWQGDPNDPTVWWSVVTAA